MRRVCYNETDGKHVGYKEDFASHSLVTIPIVQMNAIYQTATRIALFGCEFITC